MLNLGLTPPENIRNLRVQPNDNILVRFFDYLIEVKSVCKWNIYNQQHLINGTSFPCTIKINKIGAKDNMMDSIIVWFYAIAVVNQEFSIMRTLLSMSD